MPAKKPPPRKKPAAKKPATKSALPKSYAAKNKKYATNEANAAKRGKKPSSIAAKKPAKPKTAAQEFKAMKIKEDKAYKAKQAAAVKKNLWKTAKAATTSPKKKSDWDGGIDAEKSIAARNRQLERASRLK